MRLASAPAEATRDRETAFRRRKCGRQARAGGGGCDEPHRSSASRAPPSTGARHHAAERAAARGRSAWTSLGARRSFRRLRPLGRVSARAGASVPRPSPRWAKLASARVLGFHTSSWNRNRNRLRKISDGERRRARVPSRSARRGRVRARDYARSRFSSPGGFVVLVPRTVPSDADSIPTSTPIPTTTPGRLRHPLAAAWRTERTRQRSGAAQAVS